jgi:hypothetical protein
VKRTYEQRARTLDDLMEDVGVVDDLAEMNAKYAVVKVSGKTRVVEFEERPTHPGYTTPVFSKLGDFRAFLHKYKKVLMTADGGQKQVGIGHWWLEHPERRQYERIGYFPGVNDPSVLNLWCGFSVKAKAGDCGLYLDHLLQNICKGNRDHYDYLIGWMANAVQHPGDRCEVAIVLRGKEGTGKGICARYFGELFGGHFRHISQPKHLTGAFNAHLLQTTVLFADEAFFAGDRSHEGILKALITEPVLLIEPKGVDAFVIPNCLHIIMSSNSEWVVPASAEARRFVVFDVDSGHMQDHSYFQAIVDQMANGGSEALMHMLQHRNLDNFNVRAIPQTDALAEQKALTRRGIDLVIEHYAHEGVLPCTDTSDPAVTITTGEDQGEGFYVAARKIAPDLKHRSSQRIVMALCREWGCGRWRESYRRGIQFPPLVELRECFDRKHGQQEWSGPFEWGG